MYFTLPPSESGSMTVAMAVEVLAPRQFLGKVDRINIHPKIQAFIQAAPGWDCISSREGAPLGRGVLEGVQGGDTGQGLVPHKIKRLGHWQLHQPIMDIWQVHGRCVIRICLELHEEATLPGGAGKPGSFRNHAWDLWSVSDTNQLLGFLTRKGERNVLQVVRGPGVKARPLVAKVVRFSEGRMQRWSSAI